MYREAFPTGSSANIKFSKSQLIKIVQLGELLCSWFGISDLPMVPVKGFFISEFNSKGIKEHRC